MADSMAQCHVCVHIQKPKMSYSQMLTCYFGQDSLFYNSRQSLSVRVLQLFMVMTVAKAFYCCEPWQLFESLTVVLEHIK